MAQPADSFSTYDANNNREDFVDAIYQVEQTRVPFTARIPKITATATLHEWQTDDLDSVDPTPIGEGDDATQTAQPATTRLGNYTQINSRVANVSGTQEVVDKAGVGSEMAYQVAKRITEQQRDIENAALANNAKVAGAEGTPREVAGVESWIATNTSAGGTGTDPTGDGTNARGDGTQRAFEESDLKTILAACADAGADPNLILVGAFNKQAMSAFTGNNITRNTDASQQELVTSIDIYVSDFGRLEIVYSPQSRARSALVLDTNLWALASLPGRMFKQKELSVSGDYMRTQVLTEWTLEARNEKGNGIVADLTTA